MRLVVVDEMDVIDRALERAGKRAPRPRAQQSMGRPLGQAIFRALGQAVQPARRLETTPGQEKVILAAIDEVREAARKARGEARSTRKDVAGAMRAPAFDEVLFGEMFGRHDAELTELRKALVGALAKVHDALDEKQRAKLAELIESGPGFFRGGPWTAEASL